MPQTCKCSLRPAFCLLIDFSSAAGTKISHSFSIYVLAEWAPHSCCMCILCEHKHEYLYTRIWHQHHPWYHNPFTCIK